MAKSFYEITDKENSNYRNEFYKTPRGKKLYKNIRNFYIGFFIVCAICIGIFIANEIFVEESGEKLINYKLSSFENFLIMITVLEYFYNIIAREIGFRKWLKVKHNIE